MNTRDNKQAQIDNLQQKIDYENAMYETALKYPTDTAQFYNALEKSKSKISKMYEQLEKLKGDN